LNFFPSISDLEFYHAPKGIPCYCEQLLTPVDLLLQAPLDFNGSGSYTMLIEVMSADGLTVYEDATAYFSYYFFTNPNNGKHTANIRLNSFTPAMCAHVCWILHVRITDANGVYFDKYTQRYCQTACCAVPSDITTAQENVVAGGDDPPIGILPNDPPTPDSCVTEYVVIKSYYDCYDNQTGDFYGTPGTVLSGEATFTFYRISTVEGKIQQKEWEVIREYSFNCRLQRTESTRLYELQGWVAIPRWKMIEITNQLHAPYIYVNDTRYEYLGGTPFEKLEIPNTCDYNYKLLTDLNECKIWQIFGCGELCNTTGSTFAAFVVQQAGLVYNENRQVIGDNVTDLAEYYRNLTGVTDVQEVTPSVCAFAYAITVQYSGYLPNSIYVGGTLQRNRVFALNEEQFDEICGVIDAECAIVEVGTITMTATTCADAVIGVITQEEYDTVTVDVFLLPNWTDTGATALTVSQGFGYLRLEIQSTDYPESGTPLQPSLIPGVTLAQVDVAGRPISVYAFTDANNATIPADTTVTIDENGYIRYYGYPTSSDGTNGYIDVTIVYNLGVNQNLP
jgi:hypothetical protein